MGQVDYDEIAPSYDRRYAEHDYSGIERTLGQFVCGTDVLEVGCGTGRWLELVRTKGASPVGLDGSIGMLRVARQRDCRTPVLQGSAESLPFVDDSFDTIFVINALHHFPDPVDFIRESHRVLRRGGRLLTVGLDPSSGEDAWYVYDYFPGTLSSDRERYPSRQQLSEWFAGAGFEGVESFEAQKWESPRDANDYLRRGGAGKDTCSQFALLSDAAHAAGLDRIREEVRAAEEQGGSLQLRGSLTLHATTGVAMKTASAAGAT